MIWGYHYFRKHPYWVGKIKFKLLFQGSIALSEQWLECFQIFWDAFSSTPTLGTITYTKQRHFEVWSRWFSELPFCWYIYIYINIYIHVSYFPWWVRFEPTDILRNPFSSLVESSPSPGYPYGFGSKSSPKLAVSTGKPTTLGLFKSERKLERKWDPENFREI